jgi:mono/diheme cytochrome c family protein
MKTILILAISILLFFSGCNNQTERSQDTGTAWATGSFKSNGQRIYFTATSERGTPITHTGGPEMGMMMMGGRLACVSCHGVDARGGEHMMHMMTMDAPEIRWSALSEGHHHEGEEGEQTGEHEEHHDKYDFNDFKNSVEKGQHPDGDKLSEDMPRWSMSDADLRDLMNYLKSLD